MVFMIVMIILVVMIFMIIMITLVAMMPGTPLADLCAVQLRLSGDEPMTLEGLVITHDMKNHSKKEYGIRCT